MPRQHAPWAVRTLFFAAGALFATWGVQVPAVKAHHGLGEQMLALAMLAAGIGSVAGLTQAGRVVGRAGARRTALGAGLAGAVAIGLLLASRNLAALFALMLVFGVASSLFDVAINVAASELERQRGRPLMSGFHGLFSLGGMVGAAAGGLMQTAGWSAPQQLAVASVACAVLSTSGALRLHGGRDAQAAGHGLALPRGVLALIGVLAALGLLCEGAVYDWSVLYLRDVLQAPQTTAALAYASFSATMAGARFGGDWVRARLPAVAVMRGSGLLAAAGLTVVLTAGQPFVALAGFALMGLGLANVIPVLFSAGARVPGVPPAHGIAAVAALGYFGMMAGPPLVGAVAERSSLVHGLAVILLAALVLSAAAGRALRHEQGRAA